ncbi:MAG: hypothetical protein KBG28_10155 [Kofleriaceae bacterium]|nr:hypothetical protein [Kofleriaceae bacterium]
MTTARSTSTPGPGTPRAPRTLVLLAVLVLAGLAACKGKAPIAVLAETSTGTEKALASGDWAAAAVGAKFFLGDAVRTGDGQARLLLGKRAALRMSPHSLIRFGGKGGRSVDLALGEAVLETSGAYKLELGGASGSLNLTGQSGVKLVAGEQGTRFLLLLGAATLDDGSGSITNLEQGKSIVLQSLGKAVIEDIDAVLPDAAIADAAMDAPVDAVPAATATVTVTGRGATKQGALDKKPVKLPAGTSEQPEGTTVSFAGRASGSAVHQGVTVKAPSGSKLSVGGEPFLTVLAGRRVDVVAEPTGGQVTVPAGVIGFKDGKESGVSLDLRGKETRVVVTRGQVELVSKTGAKEQLQRGETAVMLPDGTIDLVDEIPDFFDLRVSAGESFTVMDHKPPTAVRFVMVDKCPTGGVVELARDKSFRNPRISAGADGANLMVPVGSWRYRVKCEGASGIASGGSITVRRGSGTKALPRSGPRYEIYANGTSWRAPYQNLLPVLDLVWRGATGGPFKVSLSGGRKPAQNLDSQTAKVSVNNLEEGQYTFFFENVATGLKSKPTTIRIEFKNVAPQAYIEQPGVGAAWGAQLAVKGAVLGGADVSVDGVKLALDDQHRFTASVPATGRALAIKISESSGTTYYLRRRP